MKTKPKIKAPSNKELYKGAYQKQEKTPKHVADHYVRHGQMNTPGKRKGT